MGLTALRKKNNLSQKELARLMGVKQSTISRFERGDREPSFKLGIKMSLALKVSPYELANIFDINTAKLKDQCHQS